MRRAFTLIELLVVIAIMTMVAGMLYPVLAASQRFSERMTTENILRKVDTALRLYKTDFGAYPHQKDYPATVGATPFPNRLAYQVGSMISTADQAKVMADADGAAERFDYVFQTNTPATAIGYASSEMADVTQNKTTVNAAYLARVAMAQARLAVLVGNLDRVGPVISARDGSIVADKRSMLVNDVAAIRSSEANPGMAYDYLRGEIEATAIDGDRVLDAWGQPLIYICRALPPFQLGTAKIADSLTTPNWRPERFGFGPIGFHANEGPGDSLLSRPLLYYNGRIRLSGSDAGDGAPTPVCAPYYPEAGNFMRSDVRYYAAPGFETEFELWSAGEDRSFAYMRDDQRNVDNIGAGPYLEGLE